MVGSCARSSPAPTRSWRAPDDRALPHYVADEVGAQDPRRRRPASRARGGARAARRPRARPPRRPRGWPPTPSSSGAACSSITPCSARGTAGWAPAAPPRWCARAPAATRAPRPPPTSTRPAGWPTRCPRWPSSTGLPCAPPARRSSPIWRAASPPRASTCSSPTLRSADEARVVLSMALAVAGSEIELRGRPAGQPERRRATALGAASVVRPRRPAGGRRRGAERTARPAPTSGRTWPRRSSGIMPACWPPARPSRPRVPGAAFFYVADPALAGLAAGSPAAAMFQIAAAQLAAHIGLPVSAVGMTTGSHEPDWQACTQNAFAALSTMAAGADLTAGAGMLGGGERVLRPAARHGLRDLLVERAPRRPASRWTTRPSPWTRSSRSASAATSSASATPARHMQDIWRPRLLDRSMWEAWAASGREGAYEKARS